MPMDIVLGDVSADRPKHENYTEYVEDLRERLTKSQQIAREHLGVAADRRKQEYDLKVKPRSFEIGEKVWYLYFRRYTAKSPKWQRHYTGPYQVVKVLPPADYVIQKSKRSEPFVVHADKLKHCYSDTPTSVLELTGNYESTETTTALPEQPHEQLTSGDSADTSVERPPKSPPKRKTAAEQSTDLLTAELDAGLDIEVGPEQIDRPRRQHRVPKRLEGYRLY